MVIELDLRAARALLLAAQGLAARPSRSARKADVLDAIRRMGALQIDTIHVVARSPYLVLWSRLGEYEPRWLEELLAEGALFEFWSHEACFLPIEDWPLYRRLMLDRRKGWRSSGAWLEEHQAEVAHVLDLARERGAVRAADFPRTDGQSGAWWNWKLEKLALEHLYNTGVLVIARRHNFHRVYAPRERVLPAWDDALAPPYEEVRRALALRAVRALGVATARWAPDYFRMPKQETVATLEALAGEGALLRARIEGVTSPAYVHPDNRALAEAAAGGRLRPSLTTLLSPFDPVVWDRARARELFAFDYTIECYTPAPKRRFGYFVLPILRRGALVGRLDAKAHRAEGTFEVKAIYLEPDVRASEGLARDVAAAIARCAAWHETPRVVVRGSEPRDFARDVAAALPELQTRRSGRPASASTKRRSATAP